jgi:hypothetical protein
MMPGHSGALPKDFAADVEGVSIDLETRTFTVKRGDRYLKLVLGGELAIVALRFVMACEADSRLDFLTALEDMAATRKPESWSCTWCGGSHRLPDCPALVTNGGLHQP